MNDQQSGAVEGVVSGIQKDFKVVGTSRVHSWYAWAMVGIVFGMALGIVYVANRSGAFIASQAATNKGITVRFSAVANGGTVHTALTSRGEMSKGFFVMNAIGTRVPTALLSLDKVTGNGGERSDTALSLANYGINVNDPNMAVVYVDATKTKAWLKPVTNGAVSFSLSEKPTVTADHTIVLQFESHIFKKGKYIQLPVESTTGTIEPGLFLGTDTTAYNPDAPNTAPAAFTLSNFSREIRNGNVATIPGMPMFSKRLKVADGKSSYGHPDFKLPGFARSGRIKLYWKDVVVGEQHNFEVFKMEYVPNPNSNPVFEPVADQAVIAGQNLSFTIKATDSDKDPIRYSMTKVLEGATVNAETGAFSWTPAASAPPTTQTITFHATDDQGGSAALTIRVAVKRAPPISAEVGPSLNTAFSSPTYNQCQGGSSLRVASFTVTAGSSQGMSLSRLTFDQDASANTLHLQNLVVKINGTQFGSTQSIIKRDGSSIVVSGSAPVNVPAGGSVIVDVYADILASSSGGEKKSVIDLKGWASAGALAGNPITFPGEIAGQNVTINCGASLSVSIAPNSPPAKTIAMGTKSNDLLGIRLNNNGNDNILVTAITFNDSVDVTAGGLRSFEKFALYDGATRIAEAPYAAVVSASATRIPMTIAGAGLAINKYSAKTLTLKADASTAESANAAVPGSVHVFKMLNPTDITAFASEDSLTIPVAITGTPVSGEPLTIVSDTFSISFIQLLGSSTNRNRSSQEGLAKMSFAAGANNDSKLQEIKLTFSGSAVADGTSSFEVDLIRTSGERLGSALKQTCTPGTGDTCAVTFKPDFNVSAGTQIEVKILVDSSSFADKPSSSDSLSVTIKSANDFLRTDGTTSNIPLESVLVPLSIATMSYE